MRPILPAEESKSGGVRTLRSEKTGRLLVGLATAALGAHFWCADAVALGPEEEGRTGDEAAPAPTSGAIAAANSTPSAYEPPPKIDHHRIPLDSLVLGRTYSWEDLLWESHPFEMGAGSLRYQLPHGFLDEDSERLTLGEARLARAGDYRLNYPRGVLTLGGDYRMGGSFRIEYRRRPYMLQSSYRLHAPGGYRAEPTREVRERILDEAAAGLTQMPSNLRVVGSKTISIEGGSGRGANLDQALKASIQGELVPGIRVNALLSDENLPIQPEGSTEELENIDKVFVEVEGRHARALFGDMSYNYAESRFTPVQRTFQGVQGELRTGSLRIAAGAARSQGDFQSVSFRGIEGLQGPYELLDTRRIDGVVILAATERVWLDGERLTRGENRDYVIDYNLGTITFSARRPVTDDSEITVDFQFSTESYRRDSFWSEAKGSLGRDNLNLNFLYFREGDDDGNPLATPLSAEDRELLATAGDDPTSAVAPGVEKVEAGLGEYVLVAGDSIGDLPHFEFSESDSADYLVSFTRVEPGEGDYVLDGLSSQGLRVFRYVGDDRGDHIVGRLLALPKKHEMASMAMSGRLGTAMKWWGEADYSYLDRNTLSDLDDENNQGSAFRIGADITPWGGPSAAPALGALSAIGYLERIDRDFASLSTERETFYYRDWNLEDSERVTAETVGEFDLGWEKPGLGKVRAGIGRLERSGDASSDRIRSSIDLGSDSERSLALRFLESATAAGRDSLTANATRQRWSGEARFGLWQVVPSVRIERERFSRLNQGARPDSGRTYLRQAYRLGKRKPRRLSVSAGYERRDTDRLTVDGLSWNPDREYHKWDVVSGYRSNAYSARIEVSHRETRFSGGTRNGVDKADLVQTEFDFTPPGSWFRSDLSYSVTKKAERFLEKAVVFVGERKGSYNERGEEVGKNKGDYNVVFLQSDSFVPIRAVEADLHLQFSERSGKRSSGFWGWVRSNVSWDQYYYVLERSTTSQTADLYLLNPRVLLRRDLTVYGTNRVRHDLELLRSIPNRGLLLRGEREKVLDSRFEGVTEGSLLTKGLARFDLSLSQHWTGRMEGEVNRRSAITTQTSSAPGQSYDVLSERGTLTGGYRFDKSWRLTVDLELLRRHDDFSQAAQTLTSISPSLNSTPKSGVALLANYRMTHTEVNETTLAKPFFFTEPGALHTWSTSLQLRISRYILVSANYFGRHEKDVFGDYSTFHDFKLESRAVF